MERDLKGGLVREGVSSCRGIWSLPCLGFKENVYYLLFGDILSKQLVLGGGNRIKNSNYIICSFKAIKARQ